MKRISKILIIIISLLSISCATSRKLQEIHVKNNTTQTTTEKEVVKDSIVYVTVENEKIVYVDKLKDTTSVLKTKYATSTVNISDGKMTHELKNNEDSIKVKIVVKDRIIKDSIYVDKEVPVKVEIEKPVRDKTFWISIIINIVIVMTIGFKIFMKFKKV